MEAADQQIRIKIREVLAARNLTQTELAQRLGVKQPSVAAVIGGKRGTIPQSLLDVLDALDLELIARSKQSHEGKV